MKKGFLVSIIFSIAFYMLPAIGLFVPTQAKAASYSNMSCYDLWYTRNLFFANKGHCFESSRTVNTFGRRCYPPYGRLSSWESDQVSNIKYWERRKGCNGNTQTYTQSRSRFAKVSGIRWNDTLAVRSGPSTRYRRIGNLPPDATGVEILECTNKWCRVRYGSVVGWSYSKYLRSY